MDSVSGFVLRASHLEGISVWQVPQWTRQMSQFSWGQSSWEVLNGIFYSLNFSEGDLVLRMREGGKEWLLLSIGP